MHRRVMQNVTPAQLIAMQSNVCQAVHEMETFTHIPSKEKKLLIIQFY